MADTAMDTAALLGQEIAAAFGELSQVRAVVMAGSRAAGVADEQSDIDLWVYVDNPIPVAIRRSIAARFAGAYQIDNQFWEPGDEWIAMGTECSVDIMYRSPDWIEAELDRVLVRQEASVGYSTSFWANVRISVALYDREGWYTQLQGQADVPYPEDLRRRIIAKNYPLLRTSFFSHRHKLELSMRRGDRVCANHCITALLASYFDTLFALNRVLHPGEKRLLDYAHRACQHVPADLDVAVNAVLDAAGGDVGDALTRVDALIDGLDRVLTDAGWPMETLRSPAAQWASKPSVSVK